uniref:Uncharacterized protein n=1 Tax=Maylandia zebra TaxID=106582 RepID=A0A3P9B7P7_9CICH
MPPSILTLRTHSSSLDMSVSSSQGLTSSRMEDLAMRAGFLDFLAAYSARRCSLILATSALSASSSDPKRSMSSSSLASFGVARGVAGRTYRLLADGRRALSVWKEFMWLYQRQRWQSVGEGGEGMASNTIMSAWDATKPSM